MANLQWNPKFQLYFTDQNKRPVLIQISKKNYLGEVFDLVGTENPVEIIWETNDDIYSPIRGSRCILNFYITDFSVFDDFYKTDEREYKVDVLYYNSAGDNYEDTEFHWDKAQSLYNANFGAAVFWEPYWSGFIVVDRWQEAVTTTPYQVTLEAIDGLGTLQGFKAPSPYKENFFETGTDYTDPNKSLFYYLKEILKKTGHTFDIYIANDIRKFDGATDTISAKFDFTEQSTIFHDIVVSDIPLYDSNLNLRNCKEVLEVILRLTNSRIFQSYGKWYIVSNSNLIDNRIDQQTVCPSGADIFIDLNENINFGEEEQPTEPTVAPDIRIGGHTAADLDGQWYFYVMNLGGDVTSATWTKPDGTTVIDNRRIPKIAFPVESAHNGQTISISVSNAAGSDSASETLTIGTYTADPFSIGGTFAIQVINYDLRNSNVTPSKHQMLYTAAEVGEPFSFDFFVNAQQFPNVLRYLTTTSLNAVTRSTNSLSGTVVHTTTKTYNNTGDYSFNPVITVNVSGTIPSFPQTNYLFLDGAPNELLFTTTVNITNNTTNTTINKTQLTFTGVKGTNFADNVTLTATGDLEFSSADNVSGLIVGTYSPPNDIEIVDDHFSQSLLLQNIDPDYVYDKYKIGVSGKIGSEDQTITLVLTGAPNGSSTQTNTAVLSPTGSITIDSNSGSFKIYCTHNGRINIVSSDDWLKINQQFAYSFSTYGLNTGVTLTSSSEVTNSVFLVFDSNREDFTRTANVYAEDNDGNVLDEITVSQPPLEFDNYNNDFNYFN